MKWFGKLIDKLRRSAPAPETALSEHNNTTNIHHMAKKTVITKAPTTDEEREGFRPKSLKEVFEHYQPSKEGVALETEEGGSVYEDFEFHQIKDFEDEQLIAQSPLLSEKKAKIDAYNAIVRQLQKNKPLRNALKDAASRASLLDVLKSLKAEIDAAE